MAGNRLELQRARAKAQRDRAIITLGGSCVCGADVQLQFHHIDPSTKRFVISRYFGRIKWRRIVRELRKCELKCTTCHMQHHKENSYHASK